MAETMRVEVVSPERLLYSGEATMVLTRTLGGGDIAFQANHAPFLGALTECVTKIYGADGSVQDLAVHGGFVEVSHNRVSILSDLAELAQEIDRDRARRAMERAEEAMRQGNDAEAEAALRRAHARMNAAGGVDGSSGGVRPAR
jgi:F-type H+-transporting ATPase subunit epsilon